MIEKFPSFGYICGTLDDAIVCRDRLRKGEEYFDPGWALVRKKLVSVDR